MKKLLLPAILLSTLNASSQLYIDNATFFIGDGAIVTVQGDVTSNVDITTNTTGKLRMGGTTTQNLSMSGKKIPNLQIDNASAAIVMTTPAEVSTLLEFTNGKIQLGNNDLTLAAAATYSGAGGAKFAETNGTGVVKKILTAAGSTTIPIGNGSNYTPVDYTTVAGTYNATTFVAARSVGSAHPNKHPRSTDYLNNYWKLSNNIAGATITAVGNYINPASVTGNQPDIVSLLFNGSFWTKGTAQAATSVTAAAPANTSQDLYGMNKFIMLNSKVFLQGSFVGATGLMGDGLRSAGLIPSTDPYRTAPYNTNFTHTANSVTETVTNPGAVFGVQANVENNIVDWVFVELRNKTSNTSAPMVQSRSVLVQRDGDLVDVDGVSPVYFKNVDSTNNYVFTIKHRNHLGISTNPANALAIGMNPTLFDFTNTANSSNIYGTAGASYLQTGTIIKNVLWGGNGNSNANTRYTGLANDKDYLLLTVLGGNPGTVVSGYSAGDFNMNGNARYTGLANDKDFLFLTVLGSTVGTVRTQSLPGY